MESLIEDNLQEFGEVGESDILRMGLRQPESLAVLTEYEKELRHLYDKWAESDARDRHTKLVRHEQSNRRETICPWLCLLDDSA